MQSLHKMLIGLALLFVSMPAIAADSTPTSPAAGYHACKEAELINGYWKISYLREEPANREQQEYKAAPYRYMAFLPRRLLAISSNKTELKTTAQVKNAILALQKGRLVLNYTIDSNGVLTLYNNRTPLRNFRCLIMDTVKGYQKGDMVLTGYSQDKGQVTEMYRRFQEGK